MLLNDFSGGQNTRVAPHLIHPNEAQIYTNIDNESGSLKPLNGHIDTGVVIDRYFTYFYAEAEWVSRANESHFVEFRDKLYISNGSALQEYYGGIGYDLGIEGPDNLVPLTGTTPVLGDDVYTYVYTYYNSSNGRESKPSLPSEEVTDLLTITIGALTPSTDPVVDKIRLYRLGGSLTQYTLVHTLDNIVTAPFLETVEDIDAAGNYILDSINNDIPLSGLKYVTEAYAMLFAALDDKLYYSEIAKPYAWPSVNYIDFEDTITGIGTLSNGILVFTEYKTYIITGNSPTGFSKFLLSGSQGCLNHNSIQFVDNQLLWMSNDGICSTNGGQINILTHPKLGKINFLEVYGSAVHDNVYYLNHHTVDGGSILAYDFRYNQIVKVLELTGNNIVSKRDRLYQHYNGTLRQLLVGDPLTMHYKSPLLVEGKRSEYKIYKEVYISYSGELNVKFYVDGVEKNSVDLTGSGTYNLKVDSSSNGYGIEFEVVGTGTIYEIDYTPQGRQK